jgi:hypothetical protein
LNIPLAANTGIIVATKSPVNNIKLNIKSGTRSPDVNKLALRSPDLKPKNREMG